MRKLQTKDVFNAARLINELNMKEEFKELMKMNNDREIGSEELGSEVLFKVMEKAAEKKSEDLLYQFLSGPLEKKPEEVAETDLFELTSELKTCIDVENWKTFFGHVSALTTK